LVNHCYSEPDRSRDTGCSTLAGTAATCA
jgi:hypothetical protein